MLRLASGFATKVDVEANVFRYESDTASHLTVRVAAGLLEQLLDRGKLYAIEATTKPLFGAGFRHRGRWYLVCKKEDWEQFCSDAL